MLTARRRRPLLLVLACWAIAALHAGCALSPPSSTPSGSSTRSADDCAELLADARRLVGDDKTDRTQLDWTVDEMAYRCEREFSTFVDEMSRTSDPAQSQGDGAPTPGPPGAILWSEAFDHVGSEKYVCGPLVNSGTSGDDVFLNLGRGYPDSDRFTIVIWDVGRIEPLSYGVTLCTTGTISLYQGTAQIEVRSTSAVEVWE